MKKFLEVLKLAMTLLPWIQEAEDKFGSGNGEAKKQFIMDAISAGGDALMARFGVPGSHIDEFTELASEAIDMGVHLAHFQGIFKGSKGQVVAAHQALAQPAPTGPIAPIGGQARQPQ
jgi:hypothetical protein